MTESTTTPDKPEDEDKRVTIFHDGECPLCRVEIRAMRRLDKDDRLAFVDITQERDALDDAGIAFDQAMNRFHVTDNTYGVRTGVAGFLCVWQQLPYLRRLVPIVTNVPGLLPILELAYRVFAKYRLVLTGRKKVLEGKSDNDTGRS